MIPRQRDREPTPARADVQDLQVRTVEIKLGSNMPLLGLLRLFQRYDVPLTIFGVAMAMERNPAVVDSFLDAGHEIASHGWRWINYQHVPEAIEREHMQRAIDVHTRLTGERPLGWYTGRTSPNTRRLAAEEKIGRAHV